MRFRISSRGLFSIAGLCLVGLLYTAQAWASAPVLALPPASAQASLAGHLEFHVDPSGTQTLAEVAADNAFVLQRGFGNGGYTAAAHWYRFELRRLPSASADWILELEPAYLNDIRVYIPQADGNWQERRLGDHTPFDLRPLQTRLHTLRISLPTDKAETFYVRVQSTSSLAFSATLWQPDAFIAKEARDNLLYGLFFGVLLLTFVLYLTLGIWLSEGTLLAYVAYIASLFLLYLGMNGYAAVLFAPKSVAWLDAMVGAGAISGGIFSLLMWDRFLDLRCYFPRLHRLILICTGLMVPGLLTVASPWYRVVAPIEIPFAVIVTWLCFGLLIWRIVRNPRQPLLLFYFMAFLAGLLGVVIQVAMTLGWLPLTKLTAHSFQLGSFAHVLVLNFALAWRIRHMQQEKLEAEHVARTSSAQATEQRQLVAMLSHEFRNPLAAISRSAQLAMIKLDGQETQRLKGIRDNADALYALVEKFLTSESLDYRNAMLARQETRLQPLITKAVHELEGDDARIRITVVPEDASFSLDRQFFVLAISNLLGNALRYSPEETQVEVTAQVGTPAAGQGLQITITDHGSGMNSADLARLGTPYFRAESATPLRGVGLGFLLARKIVEAHQGTLTMRSSPGQGTTATITLPISCDR